MRKLTVAGVLALGLLLTAGALLLIVTSDHEEQPALAAVTQLLGAWSFILGGLVAWARRPDNRFGPLLTAVGMTVFIGALEESNHSLPFTLGWVFGGVFVAVFIHALLAFPRGYLETRMVFSIVAVAYVALTAGSLLASFFDDFSDDCTGCPPNAFLIVDSPTTVSVIDAVLVIAGIPALLASLHVFRRRWREASEPMRRVFLPVYLAAGTTIVLLAAAILIESFSDRAGTILSWFLIFSFSSVPIAFIVGLLSGRLRRASVGQLVLDLGRTPAPGELRDALARALGDPTLRVAYWIPETQSFADIDGSPIELPEGRGEVLSTMVEHNGRIVAALIHHRSLEEDPLLVEAAAAAAALALENEQRLAALAKAQTRIQALLDAFPDLIFRMSRDGVYLEFNGPPEQLAVPPEELIGATLQEVLPIEVAEQLLAGIRRAIDTDEIVTGEYRLELDGVPRDFEARIVKAGDEAVIIGREFTERNQAQAELERLHAELSQRHRDLEHERDFIRTVVDSTPSLLCLATPGGYIVRFNTSLERLAGRPDNDVTRGNAFWDVFIAPEDREVVRRQMEEVVAEGGRGEYENNWITADGERRRVTWSTTPLRDDRGDPRLAHLWDGHHRAQAARGRAAQLARPHRRGERRRAPPTRAQPPRRRTAAPRLALPDAAPRAGACGRRARGGRPPARPGLRRARAGTRGAAGAGARHPPRGALGPRPDRRDRGARRADAARGRPRASRPAPPRAGRGGRVLRRLRIARERGQVRRGILGRR